MIVGAILFVGAIFIYKVLRALHIVRVRVREVSEGKEQ